MSKIKFKSETIEEFLARGGLIKQAPMRASGRKHSQNPKPINVQDLPKALRALAQSYKGAK